MQSSDARRGAPRRALPVGAELVPGGVSFRVWAPAHERASVVLGDGSEHPLRREPSGHFSDVVARATAGTLYRFRVGDDRTLHPDPASRFQPEGPHGPSQVVDPGAYAWRDAGWRGVRREGQVLYEMHVGTFTPQGTWRAAAAKLDWLRDVGITSIEMMPVNDFPGRFGWGYDGVNLFAPTRLYGEPDHLRAFVDAAHGLGLGVILDVVYNHFGPDGSHVPCFTRDYFTDRYENEWGEAINFDGPRADGVREFFVANAAHWIAEFHFDGLRIDATQSIHDASPRHVIADIVASARAAAGGRDILVVGENEPQHARLVRAPEDGGLGLDALWNDDLHHSAMVALTGRSEAYYEDHRGTPQEFISAAKYGYLFQGQRYAHQRKRRGTPALDLPPAAFVNFLQNHDQVANSASGWRFHALTSPGRARAMTALLLLLPGTPMLFQGQEFGASTPFLYFADHVPGLADKVRDGRRDFLAQFPSIASAETQPQLADPGDPGTFERSKLDWSEAARHGEWVALHRDLLRLRREDPVFRAQRRRGLDGAVVGDEALVLRWFGDGDRLLLVNLGRDVVSGGIAEPLLAPADGRGWATVWSSESPAYGGGGTPAVESEDGWRLPGHAAVVLAPREAATRPG